MKPNTTVTSQTITLDGPDWRIATDPRAVTIPHGQVSERETISLDGQWQVAEGSMEKMPETFDRTVSVPGLVDMAVPSFEQVGVTSPRRQAYWYKKKFTVSGPQRAMVTLKIAKAQFGIWRHGLACANSTMILIAGGRC